MKRTKQSNAQAAHKQNLSWEIRFFWKTCLFTVHALRAMSVK